MYGEEDNYDEDENELYDNKSELLIAEDRQTNNSPTSGAAAVSGVVGGTRSSDLMNMMMMMTLNSGGDQMSLNGGAASGVGVSSSLATTALPTIITPLYSTDNENFVMPPTRRSAIKKMKTIRGTNKKSCYSNQIKSKQSNRKLKSLCKISNILDVIQIETKNQIISATAAAAAADSNKEQCIEIEKLKQLESVIQEERLKRQIQKQHKRRKQRQLQLQLQMQQQQKLENETKTPSEIAAVPVATSEAALEKNQLESEQAMMIRRSQRRRRRRDSQIDVAQLPPANISFSSILLLPEEIENLKKRVKEGNAIKHQQQQNRQLKNPTKITSEPSIELAAASVPTNCDENKAKCPPYVDDTADQEAIKTSMPSTILQKRVSFIMTPTDEDSAKNMLVNTNSSEITDENTKAKLNNSLLDNLYYNHEKMKKILKTTHQNITNSPSRNSLQAKVFKSYDGDQSAMKPLLLSSYKQKPPPKLDSLYTTNELITLSNTNVNKNIYATQQQQQQQHHQQEILSNNRIYTSSSAATATNNNMMISTNESEYNSENKSKLIKSNQYSNELASNLIQSTHGRIQPQIREQPNILMKRNSAALRNVSTPTSSPTSTAINRLDILKSNFKIIFFAY